MRKLSLLFTAVFLLSGYTYAQNPGQAGQAQRPYSIIIKGGHVIDPKNNIDEIMDIAVISARAAQPARPAQEARPAQGDIPARPAQPARPATPRQESKIALVAKNIDPDLAAQVVNAQGMYVVPGLIDLHTHVFYGPNKDNYLSDGSVAVLPDGYTFKAGVTTVVDAGGAGWKSFDLFKKNIIDISQTRVLSLINIVGAGMKGGAREQNVDEMDARKAAEVAMANKDYVVGFKLAHYEGADWRTPVSRVAEAGKIANLPVMIDFGGNARNGTPPSIEELFTTYLRPGDIYTHVFTQLAQREPIIDPGTGALKPFVMAAQKRGIIFDVGFGSGSFDFRQAIPALKAGFYPNTMGTDLHAQSIIGSMKDQLNVMSIFLAMGMDIPGIIKAATWSPAQAIHREELGNLSVGSVADIAILSMRQGNFGFMDIARNKQTSNRKFECEMTIRGGAIRYDLNGITTSNVAARR